MGRRLFWETAGASWRGVSACGLLLWGTAGAQEPEAPEVRLHGDLKSFTVASFPYEHPLMPEGASVMGLVDGRLKLSAHWGEFSGEAHHVVTLFGGGVGLGLGGTASAGVGLTAPEAAPLTWEEATGDLVVRGRTDRLWLRGSLGSVDLTVGRQPISFGAGRVFTPMDLVAPFHPATIDTEYKPGVDSVRIDGYLGVSGQITAVAAYAGDWADGMVYAVYGQGTVGVTDLGAFLGMVHNEPVLGLTVATSAGPVGLFGDATVTFASEEAFVRAVGGADWRPTSTTTLSGEVYVQTFGASDPGEYLMMAQHPRVARGEVWLFGRSYGALSVAQELGPLVSGSLALIANLEDPSALVAPVLAWNVADNAALSAGAFVGVGQRPQVGGDMTDLGVRSEFGLYPAALFLRMATYF